MRTRWRTGQRWRHCDVRLGYDQPGWIRISKLVRHDLMQGCGAGVVRSRRFSGGVGVGFLTTLEVGVGFFCSTPTSNWIIFLHQTPKLGIPVEMVQLLLKLLLKQRFLAVHHDFHWFWEPNFIPFMLRCQSRKFWKGRSRKFWRVDVGVGSRKFWKGQIFYLRLRTPGLVSLTPRQKVVSTRCLHLS